MSLSGVWWCEAVFTPKPLPHQGHQAFEHTFGSRQAANLPHGEEEADNLTCKLRLVLMQLYRKEIMP